MTTIISGGRPTTLGAKAFPLPTSTSVQTGPSAGNVPLLRGDAASATYEGMFKSQPMVYAVVNKLVHAVARNPLKAYDGLEADERQRLRGHSLDRLIRRPYPRGSENQLKKHVVRSLKIYGKALLLKSRPSSDAAPTELWPIPWRNVGVIEDERGPIGFVITIGATNYTVGPEDVIYFDDGISPLEPLRRTLALEDAAITFQGQSLANGMTQRGAFTSEQRLNDNSIPRLRAELEKLYSGVANAGRIALLDGGLKFQNIGQSAVDADLMAQRRLSREEVCAVYDIAPALLGLEKATYASQSELRKGLYDSIATDLVMIEETIQAQLVESEPEWDGAFVEFDTGELLRPDPEARARMHMLTQQSSSTSINERRKLENLPRIDDPIADTVFMPANMIPVGVDTPATDQTTAGTPAQGVADLVTASLVREVMEDVMKELPAPTVNLVLPEDKPKSRRLERDTNGNIARIIEE